MFDVVLYFSDSINLRAFKVIELISSATIRDNRAIIKENDSILEAPMDWEQVDKACNKFGAVVKRMSKL